MVTKKETRETMALIIFGVAKLLAQRLHRLTGLTADELEEMKKYMKEKEIPWLVTRKCILDFKGEIDQIAWLPAAHTYVTAITSYLIEQTKADTTGIQFSKQRVEDELLWRVSDFQRDTGLDEGDVITGLNISLGKVWRILSQGAELRAGIFIVSFRKEGNDLLVTKEIADDVTA